MIRVFVGLIVLILANAACSAKKEQDIIKENEMAHILIHMYLAEERISSAGLSYDSIDRLIPVFREKIFAELGIAEDLYRRSMEYYMANPKQLEHIYTAVVDSLSLREQSLSNELKTDGTP